MTEVFKIVVAVFIWTFVGLLGMAGIDYIFHGYQDAREDREE